MACLTAFVLGSAAVRATAQDLELLLRDGKVLHATALRGDPGAGYVAATAAGERRLAGPDVLAVLGTAAAEPPLAAAWLAGGDVVRGALGGGDNGGNRLDLVSPVFGRVAIAVDRLAAFAAPGCSAPLALVLPEGVDEALFVRAAVGFDVLAGSLHQFGEGGVRFEPQGADAPRWFRGEDFAALRLRDPEAPAAAPLATLTTRVGDRVGITAPTWGPDGLTVVLEGGARVTVRTADVACFVVHRDVVFLSDLEPQQVDEAGFDGEVVHPFRRDRNVLGAPLVAAGRSPAKGLGVHAQSRLVFRVPDGVDRFWTRVAFDDSAAGLGLLPRADVEIRVNDRTVFSHRNLTTGTAPLDPGVVPVRPGDLLVLVVEPGAGRDLGDRVDWLCPVFLPPLRRP